jgi:hypothetical protein
MNEKQISDILCYNNHIFKYHYYIIHDFKMD